MYLQTELTDQVSGWGQWRGRCPGGRQMGGFFFADYFFLCWWVALTFSPSFWFWSAFDLNIWQVGVKGQRVKGGGGVKESRGNYFFCEHLTLFSHNFPNFFLLLRASHPFFSQFSNFFFFCEHLTLFSHNFPLFFILRASHSFFLTFFLSFHSVHISPFWIENSTFELPELYTYLYGPWVNADIEIGHKEWLLRLQTFM